MATSFHKITNNATSTLAAGLNDSDLSFSVNSGDGSLFDAGVQWVTIGRTATYKGEILDITSRTGDTFTVASRGAQSTVAVSHEAGDLVECLLTAGHLSEMQDAINALEP